MPIYTPHPRIEAQVLPPPITGKVYVYCLIDPVTWETRYVGRTKNPKTCMQHHFSDMRGMRPKKVWLRDLYNSGHWPVFYALAEVPRHESFLTMLIWQVRTLADNEPLFTQAGYHST